MCYLQSNKKFFKFTTIQFVFSFNFNMNKTRKSNYISASMKVVWRWKNSFLFSKTFVFAPWWCIYKKKKKTGILPCQQTHAFLQLSKGEQIVFFCPLIAPKCCFLNDEGYNHVIWFLLMYTKEKNKIRTLSMILKFATFPMAVPTDC